MLRTEPSFCIYTSEEGVEENDVKDFEEGKGIGPLGGAEFSFARKDMGLIDEEEGEEEDNGKEGKWSRFKDTGLEEQVEPASPPMYMAPGLGADGVGGGGSGGVELRRNAFDENSDVEEHYKALLCEEPYNPLILSNYAQLLEFKGDHPGAEEFYFRAILADPKDGRILLKYAQLVWELHRDQDRAWRYFECAARVAPEDSDVLAACARFLWEIDDNQDENEDSASNDHTQSRGETVGAEDYYARAMLADPENGEVISQYAKLVWELHCNRDRASCYFERSVEVAPEDCHVLAAYARFLWETETEDEEHQGSLNKVQPGVTREAIA